MSSGFCATLRWIELGGNRLYRIPSGIADSPSVASNRTHVDIYDPPLAFLCDIHKLTTHRAQLRKNLPVAPASAARAPASKATAPSSSARTLVENDVYILYHFFYAMPYGMVYLSPEASSIHRTFVLERCGLGIVTKASSGVQVTPLELSLCWRGCL